MNAKDEYTAWRVSCLEHRVATLEDQLRRATVALESLIGGSPSPATIDFSALLEECRHSLWDYEEEADA